MHARLRRTPRQANRHEQFTERVVRTLLRTPYARARLSLSTHVVTGIVTAIPGVDAVRRLASFRRLELAVQPGMKQVQNVILGGRARAALFLPASPCSSLSNFPPSLGSFSALRLWRRSEWR